MARALKFILAAIAIAYVICYLCLAILRVPYPFELEWMEGGSVDQVARVLAGERLYVLPTADFVPYIYPPLYFYAAALVARLIGIGFAPLRIVSLLSSLGSIVLIFLFVKRETGNRLAALLAACLFAATFRIGGAWMDIARVDSLFVFLLLFGIYVIRFADSTGSRAAAGALVTLAFLTKQVAILAALPVIVFFAFTDRRRSIPFVAPAIILPAAAHVILDRLHGGLYHYYTYDLPHQHAIAKKYAVSFWTTDIALPFTLALGLAIAYFYIRHVRKERTSFFFYLFLSIGILGSSWASKVHLGSYANVLMPVHALLAVLFGLGFDTAGDLIRHDLPAGRRFAEALLYVLCIIQFAGLAYDPSDQLPTGTDRRAGEALLETVARIDGEVFMPFHPYYSAAAGKRSCAHEMAIRDVLRARDCPARRHLSRDIETRLRERRYAAIILDTDSWEFIEEIERHYSGPDSISAGGHAFYPVTGTRTRPTWVWYASGSDSGREDR